MKILKKIKLINWHYFINETMDIKGHTLITGENGAGKSTILDALQFVLTCGKQYFNQAANDKASRDLIGYVRCKTGRDSNQYERNGDVTSHIALEFYDQEKKDTFIVGSVIDSASNLSTPKSIFYRLEKVEITDELFIFEGIPRKISDFKVCIKDLTYKISQTQEEARNDFRNRFGALNSRFFSLLPKALAFRPINNVKDFVYSYLLDEKEVHIDLLKENIRTLTEFEKFLKIIKEKLNRLELINKTYEDLLSIEENMKIQDYIVLRTDKEIKQLTIKDKNNEKQQLLTNLILNENKLKEQISRYGREKNYLMNLESSLLNNDNYQLLKQLEKEKETLMFSIQDLKLKNQLFDNKIKEVYNFILLLHNKAIDIKGMENLYKFKNETLNEVNISSFIDAIKVFNQSLKEYKNQVFEEKAKIKFDLSKLLKDLEEIEDDIRRLECKQLIFPNYLTKLKDVINQEMKKEHGIDVMPRVLCELLEVKDPIWQNAVEGYLNTQRFNLIVEPVYFDFALRIYEKMKDRLQIHSIGLVNTQKLAQFEEEFEGSLASLVTSQNQYAKQYINMLLNHVVCCESVDDLKNYQRSITPTCMVYQNHTARHINPEIYRTPYIGLDAYKKQLELKLIEKNKIIDSVKTLRYKISEIDQFITLLESIDLNYVKENCLVKTSLIEVASNLKETEFKISEIDQKSFIELQMKISTIKEEIHRLDQSNENLRNEISDSKARVSYLDRELSSLNNEQIQLNDQLLKLEENILSIVKKAEERYSSATKDKDLKVVNENYLRQKQGTTTRYYNVLNELTTLQREYNREYHFGAGFGPSGMESYYLEYKTLRDSKMVEFEEKIRQSKKKAEEQFQNEFVSKLQENILNAQREFKKLNEALKGIYFGEDEYRFEFYSDKEHEKFYHMIMDDSNIGGDSLFSSSFREKHKEALENLFDKIAIDDDLSKKALETFTDYRTYMDYDIKIMHRNGTTSSFSKVCREKSGGETQTPYYVAIAASFLQLYFSNQYSDSIGLILFDEAFDKMDENRIESMMSFLNKLKLQIILAAPPQKIETISPFVQTNFVVYRENNNAFVEEFHYEKVS